jgi:hypothetical protein
MTDFLSNLLMRSTVNQPMVAVLQPRLPSLFEPQRGVEENRLALPDETVQESFSPADRPAMRRISANDSPVSPAGMARVEEFPIRIGIPRPMATSTRTPEESTLEVGKGPSQQRLAVQPVSFLQEPPQSVLHRTDDAPTVGNRPVQNASTLISENAGRPWSVKPLPMDEKQINTPKIEKGTEEDVVAEKTALSLAKITPTLNGLKPVLLPQPLAIPSSLAERQHLGSTQEASSQQVIEIHIARIEVRATPPATSGKQSSQFASKTSLDDYLRSRSGGKR